MLTKRDLTGEGGVGNKNRDWNAAERLEGWRESWADPADRALEQAGHDERIDHRPLKDQREAARDRGDEQRRVQARNRERRGTATPRRRGALPIGSPRARGSKGGGSDHDQAERDLERDRSKGRDKARER